MKFRFIIKWLSRILLVVIALPVVLISIIYIPFVQEWAVKKACSIASEETGMLVSIDKVRLTFLLDVELQSVSVVQGSDTLLRTEDIVVDLDFSKIFDLRIGVDGIDIINGELNTLDLVTQAKVVSEIGKLHLDAHDIDLNHNNVVISSALIENSNVDIALQDTTVVDTTDSEPIPWSIDIRTVSLQNSGITLHMPNDSMSISAYINTFDINTGDISLEYNIYKIKDVSLCVDTLTFIQKKVDDKPFVFGLRESCIALKDVGVDTKRADIGYLSVTSGESFVNGNLSLDFDALTPTMNGNLNARLKASVKLPELNPINAQIAVWGNVDKLHIDTLNIGIPSVVDARAEGFVCNLLDIDDLKAKVNFDVRTGDLSIVKKYAHLGNDIRLPRMSSNGCVKVEGKKYNIDAVLKEGKGDVKLVAAFDALEDAYSAKVKIKDINVSDFLPHDSIGCVNLLADIEGRGLDLLSPTSRFAGKASLNNLEYKNWNISDVTIGAQLSRGELVTELASDNRLLEALACLEAKIKNREIESTRLTLDMSKLDLKALGLVKDSLVLSMRMHADAASNLKDTHDLNAAIRCLQISTADTVFYPMDLHLDMHLNPDTIAASADAGDLKLSFNSPESLDSVLYKFDVITSLYKEQIESRDYDPDTIRLNMPDMAMRLYVKENNPLANIAKSQGFLFKEIDMNLRVSQGEGIFGDAHIWNLKSKGTQVDTIYVQLKPQGIGQSLLVHIENNKKNRVGSFESNLKANFMPTAMDASLEFIDSKRRKGVDIGFALKNLDSTLVASVTPEEPILAYRKFKINGDNFVSIDRSKHIKANVDLLADDGTGLKLYSAENTNSLQDLTLSLSHFNLGEFCSVLPYIMPDVKGYLSGDVHAVQDSTQSSLSVQMDVDDLKYESAELGNVGLNLVYLPNADGTQMVDGILTQNGDDILLLNGKYWSDKKNDFIKANAELIKFPMSLANGFIPDNLARLEGYAFGNVRVDGEVSNPIINGELSTDSFYIHSDPYSVNMRVKDDTLKIEDSQIKLDRIEAYTIGDNPLVLDGYINFQDLDDINLDIQSKAKDFLLINAPKNKRSTAYGKAYVDVDTRIYGTLENLNIDGNLNILGKTDLTYVMKDSPISVDDQMSNLVTFCDFTDTLVLEPETSKSMDIKIRMGISIDEATTIHALLSEDGSDKVDIEGGGDLSFVMDAKNGPRLYGRYTILSGKMDYSMVVVSLKNFQIKNGSYIEFNGDILNPYINLSATERIKATVTENKIPRSVAFDVGLNITRTLSNLGLEFTVEAPEDLSLQNELATMSPTQRGRIAVTLLATGLYVSDSYESSGSIDATGALSSYLQSELGNIAGKALSTVDIGFGIDNTKSMSGADQTNYNFSFAKRFWGNRISVMIGGKVSSGNDAVNDGQSIINNASVEYRLDNSGTRNVKVYYDRNYQSLMEGILTEIGAGLVFRKKSQFLRELFIFNTKKKKAEKQ